jgi:hypothetical protein
MTPKENIKGLLNWLLSGIALLAWAIYCYVARDFPLWITIGECIIGGLMVAGTFVAYVVRSWMLVSQRTESRSSMKCGPHV